MLTDSVTHDDTKATSLPDDITDDSCKFEYIEIVPLTRDSDGPCTTECDGGDWSGEVTYKTEFIFYTCSYWNYQHTTHCH